MADVRLPGPMCSLLRPLSLDDGTQPRWLAGLPGPWCPIDSTQGRAVEPRPVTSPPVAPAGKPDVGYLFDSCRHPAQGLSAEDYARAAASLKVEAEAIQAVSEVETAGAAFDGEGRPRILFERHYFHRLTHGKWDRTHARISQKSSGGYGKFSIQYAKLEEAWKLDRTAALRSASWGRFQIMGDNFAAAGHASVEAFVDDLAHRESAHLAAFVSFVASDAAKVKALRDHDWATFAKRYNGAGYAKNAYDTKMKAAFDRLVAARAAVAPAVAPRKP